jgi:hypothetical protein
LAGFSLALNGSPIPKGVDSGIRDSNGLYSEMNTAHDWGIDPDTWYTRTRAARAMMIATSIMWMRIDNEMADRAAVKHGK